MKNPYTPEPITVDHEGNEIPLDVFLEKFQKHAVEQGTIPANLELEEGEEIKKILGKPVNLETYQDRIEQESLFE